MSDGLVEFWQLILSGWLLSLCRFLTRCYFGRNVALSLSDYSVDSLSIETTKIIVGQYFVALLTPNCRLIWHTRLVLSIFLRCAGYSFQCWSPFRRCSDLAGKHVLLLQWFARKRKPCYSLGFDVLIFVALTFVFWLFAVMRLLFDAFMRFRKY